MPDANFAIRFEAIFQKLLADENVSVYEKDLSQIFEAMAMNLLADAPGRDECYFDGVAGLTSTINSPRQIEFNGEMWIGRSSKQWTESFRATATDKRSTKQGIWMVLRVGDDRMEAELASIFE